MEKMSYKLITEEEINEFLLKRDAKIRHLKSIRDRYHKYMHKMPDVPDRVICGSILAQNLYKKAQQEKI